MMRVDEATEVVFKEVAYLLRELPSKTIPFTLAQGGFLDEDVYADRAQPPFNRVAMDGISISETALGCKSWKIAGIQKPGEPQRELLDPFQCFEVMTGAPLPKGCSTVIPYEKLDIQSECASLKAAESFENLKNIHQYGSDYKEGEKLLDAQTFLTSAHIAVLASIGKTSIKVKSLPRIAFVSTGDELIAPEKEPLDYQIRQSNSYAMQSEIQGLFSQIDSDIFHLVDEKNEIKGSLEGIINDYDFVILSGGVSMGKFDYVPQVLEELGITKRFHKIAQRPGKPLWFGVKEGASHKIIMGMPGNPVSSLVSLRRYLCPALLNAYGPSDSLIHGTLSESVEFMKELTYFMPVRVSLEGGAFTCEKVEMNGSGDYYSLSQSDGFLELPFERSVFNKGESFPLYLWASSKRRLC